MEVVPADEFNQQLVARAHPSDWTNPTPGGRYNLVAIGGGTAGIISALLTAGLGGRAALIERHLLGGDCLNYGCVPSKALIRAARAAHQVSISGQYGVRVEREARVDFPSVMQRMRRLRAAISNHDSAERFRSLGADVFLGQATFTGRDTLEVDGQTVRFRRAVIATGARAAHLDIPGMADVGFLTNETVFSLTELPRRLITIGSGPIGCELAQAFRRFGSEVHLVNRSNAILSKEDPEAAAVIQRQFEREGIHLQLGCSILHAEKTGNSKSLVIERDGEKTKLLADEILLAVGRKANVDGLGLNTAGVAYGPKGIEVDDRLKTSNPLIYAAGDICSKHQFTHAADAMARIAVQNALFPYPKKKMSSLVIPRCTYTDPEVAHVGMTPAEARSAGIEPDSYRIDLKEVDRAIVDGEDEGFAVVHTRPGSGSVLGATIVASHAGEMIGQITQLMANNLSLGHLGRTIHCYPTQVEALKRIADQYSRTRLTPRVATAFKKWLAWRR